MTWARSRDVLHTAIAGHFGERVVYTPFGGAPLNVDGEWHEDPVEANPGSEVQVSDQQHSIDLRLSDLPAEPEPGATILSAEAAHVGLWNCIHVQLNGDGKATLFLHRP